MSKSLTKVKVYVKSSKFLQEWGRNTKSITLQIFILTESSHWKQQFPSLYYALQPHLSISFWYSLDEVCFLQGRHIHMLTSNSGTLFRNREFPDALTLRWDHIGLYWALIQWLVSVQEGALDTQKGHHVSVTGETRGSHLQVKGSQGLLANTGRWEK